MSFQLAIIEWDQKRGGQLTEVAPNKSFTLTSGEAMNIYNMHRIRRTKPNFGSLNLRLSDGKRYKIASFFSGYGASTSPNGFTGNYGAGIIGVAEKIICLFLENEKPPESYFNILGKISSRVLLQAETMGNKIDIIANIIRESRKIDDVESLSAYLDDERLGIDSKLGLNQDQIAHGNELEVKILRNLIDEQYKKIQELKFDTASSVGAVDSSPVVAEINKYKLKIKELNDIIKEKDTQINLLEMYKKQKSQLEKQIRQLKGSGAKLPSTGGSNAEIMELKSNNESLKAELQGVKESTQSLLNDLRGIIQQKDTEIANYKKRLGLL